MSIGEQPTENVEKNQKQKEVIKDPPFEQNDQEKEHFPDILRLAEEKISDLNPAAAEIQSAGENEFNRIKKEYQPSPGLSAKYKKLFGGVAAQSKESIARAIRNFVIGVSMFVASGIAEGSVLEKPIGKTQEGVKVEELQNTGAESGSEKIETIQKSVEAYNKEISKLKNSAIENNHEEVLITAQKNGTFEFVEGKEDEERSNFSFIPFNKIDEFIKNGAKKIEIIHTHPWSALPGYFYDKKIRDGKPIPMPPSVTDLTSLILELHHFKEKDKLIENKAIDPTGEWTFKISDENNYFIEKYVDLLEKVKNPDFFTAEEKAEYSKNTDLMKNVHPEEQQYYLSHVRDKMEKEFIKYFPEKKEDSPGEDKSVYLENFIEVSKLCQEINTYDEDRSKEETKALIEKYMGKCKEIGIDVSYKPFE